MPRKSLTTAGPTAVARSHAAPETKKPSGHLPEDFTLLLRGWDSNPELSGYEPDVVPFHYPACVSLRHGTHTWKTIAAPRSSLSEEQHEPATEPPTVRWIDAHHGLARWATLDRDQPLTRSHVSEVARAVHDERVRLTMRDLRLELRIARELRVDLLLRRPPLLLHRVLSDRYPHERAAQHEPRGEQRDEERRAPQPLHGRSPATTWHASHHAPPASSIGSFVVSAPASSATASPSRPSSGRASAVSTRCVNPATIMDVFAVTIPTSLFTGSGSSPQPSLCASVTLPGR